MRFLRDSFPVYSADEDASGKPLLVEQLDPTQYQSFPLVESRSFAFDLSSLPRDMRVTDMDISSAMPTIPIRFRSTTPPTGEWDEYKRYTVDDITGLAKVETSLPDLQEYLMNGFLYCRFERLGAADGYADIDIPTIIMEGRGGMMLVLDGLTRYYGSFSGA